MQLKNKLTQADRARIKARQEEMNMKLVKRTIDKNGKMKVILGLSYHVRVLECPVRLLIYNYKL